MVVERQHIAGNGNSTSTEQPFDKVSTKRVRPVPSQNIYRPPAARKLEALLNAELSSNAVGSPPVAQKVEKVRVAKQRRPDIQVYVPRAKRASALVEKDPEPCQNQPQRRSLDSSVSNGAVSKSPSLHSRWGSGTLVSVSEGKVSSDPPTPRSRKLVRHSFSDLHVSSTEPAQGCSSSEVCDGLDEPSRVVVNGEVVEAECVRDGECAGPSSDDRSASGETVMELESCTRLTDTNGATDCENVELSVDKSVTEEKVENMNESGSEVSEPVLEVVSLDILSTECARERKKDEDEEACKTREEQNRKNRRILRGNYMSDVLIISDPEKPDKCEPALVPEPAPQEDASRSSSGSGGTTVVMKKKKVNHKSESPSASSTNSSPAIKLNPDECTWDMMFDDSGECLDPKLMEELTSAVGSVTIAKPHSNYEQYHTKTEHFLPGADDEFAHVVEIYNFPPEFKTQDLLSVFSPYKNGGFEIKWVDDTHALGVFSSSVVAADVLATEHPFVKTRPLREATPESRSKARRSAEFLQPYRARPETCVALARRLVTASLGVRLNTSREEREAERKMLREAREKKRLVARQREDAWEGNIGEK